LEGKRKKPEKKQQLFMAIPVVVVAQVVVKVVVKAVVACFASFQPMTHPLFLCISRLFSMRQASVWLSGGRQVEKGAGFGRLKSM